jgi:hypothetical protein
MIVKTSGLLASLRAALAGLAGHIRGGFVFGRWLRAWIGRRATWI